MHWHLPAGLTRPSANAQGGGQFPAVPNRWLVSRASPQLGAAQWIIESDYLHPPGASHDAVSFPFLSDDQTPFRLLGRTVRLDEATTAEPGSAYLRGTDGQSLLTAIGYGEPTFASYYPNCRSVFGFHDTDIRDDNDLTGLSYELLGWYSNLDDDLLSQARDCLLSSKGTINDVLRREFGWSVAQETQTALSELDGILCHGRLDFAPESAPETVGALQVSSVSLASNGEEALAAYLARDVVPDSSASVFDAIFQHEDLAEASVDRAAKFNVVRHDKSFTARDAGRLWSISALSQAGETSNQGVPAGLADALAALNEAQRQFDRTKDRIAALRSRLFSDWYEYQLSLYHETDEDTGEDAQTALGLGGDGDDAQTDPFGAESGQSDGDDANTPVTGYRGRHVSAQIIRDYLENHAVPEVEGLIAECGEFSVESATDAKNVTSVDVISSGQHAARVSAAAANLISQIEDMNARVASEAAQNDTETPPIALGLFTRAAPRCWQPKEPSILIAGPCARSQSHPLRAKDGTLPIAIVKVDDPVKDLVQAVSAENRRVLDAVSPPQVWKRNTWSAHMVEWSAEYYPSATSDALTGEVSPFQLSDTDTNLTLEEGPDVPSLVTVVGTSLVSPQIKDVAVARFESFLRRAMLADFKRSQRSDRNSNDPETGSLELALLDAYLPSVDRSTDAFDQNLCDIIRAYDWAQSNADIEAALQAYVAMTRDGFGVLSQSLSGFNATLLTHKQTLQLPVDDPRMESAERNGFVHRLANLIGNSNVWAPRPVSTFSPVRSGALSISQLRLIDCFGQVMEIDRSDQVLSEMATPSDNGHQPGHLTLSPRITQPARLFFRWLDAETSEAKDREAFDAATPLCGWILPNFLDNSLAVYAADGAALGQLGVDATWTPAPGGSSVLNVGGISNDHLRRVVTEIQHSMQTESGFGEALVVTLQNALEHIDPVDAEAHKSMALLCGRPIAVVRAMLDLQLQGPAAIDRTETSFADDMERWDKTGKSVRTTKGIEDIRFPIRLGEYHQLNDGLIGYWVEDRSETGEISFRDQTFHAPQSTTEPSPSIRTHGPAKDSQPVNITHTFGAEPQTLTLFMDPRCKVHATTGILPTKSIELPREAYADALEAIEVTFEAAPILSDRSMLRLPLGPEAGSTWSWLERRGDDWTEISSDPEDQPSIGDVGPDPNFQAQHEIRDGWLVLRRAPRP
ncbi:hypothetical protein [Shimia ponticola]|uniref:hypothetical protein n=1 Tax=Shimia ponticola TaxID=2582893 RepID=UPI00164A8298|nr:hypothetical protein [Shimia ponticola]